MNVSRLAAFVLSAIALPIMAEKPHDVGAFARTVAHEHAAAVMLDWKSGDVIAQAGGDFRSTPGSAIKPLLLDYALQHGIVTADTRVYCRRSLRIAGRALPCTHPSSQPVFTAESALAESCNTWFAELGRRYTGTQLDSALDAVHITHVSLANSDQDHRELAALGLFGTTTTPLELARSYRAMLLRQQSDSVIKRGLTESVQYGMANPARIDGVPLMGKTGTASNAGEAWTHGWFAGAVSDRLVLVVYVPHGDGGTAAKLARSLLLEWGAR